MPDALRAIETEYRGYRFRSRLEARWAVFFQVADVKWQYEIEGFDMEGVWYLPDFYLPDERLFIEIKPSGHCVTDDPKAGAFVDALARRHRAWLDDSHAAWELLGYGATPEAVRELTGHGQDEDIPGYRVIVGDPYPGSYTVWQNAGAWFKSPARWSNGRDEGFAVCPLCHRTMLAGRLGVSAEPTGDCEMLQCMWCDIRDRNQGSNEHGYFHKGWVIERRPGLIRRHPRLLTAYAAARGARFEHGERGPTPKAEPRSCHPDGAPAATGLFHDGDQVRHRGFGVGRVVTCTPWPGGDAELEVRFEGEAMNRFMLQSYGHLELLP